MTFSRAEFLQMFIYCFLGLLTFETMLFGALDRERLRTELTVTRMKLNKTTDELTKSMEMLKTIKWHEKMTKRQSQRLTLLRVSD